MALVKLVDQYALLLHSAGLSRSDVSSPWKEVSRAAIDMNDAGPF